MGASSGSRLALADHSEGAEGASQAPSEGGVGGVAWEGAPQATDPSEGARIGDSLIPPHGLDLRVSSPPFHSSHESRKGEVPRYSVMEGAQGADPCDPKGASLAESGELGQAESPTSGGSVRREGAELLRAGEARDIYHSAFKTSGRESRRGLLSGECAEGAGFGGRPSQEVCSKGAEGASQVLSRVAPEAMAQESMAREGDSPRGERVFDSRTLHRERLASPGSAAVPREGLTLSASIKEDELSFASEGRLDSSLAESSGRTSDESSLCEDTSEQVGAKPGSAFEEELSRMRSFLARGISDKILAPKKLLLVTRPHLWPAAWSPHERAAGLSWLTFLGEYGLGAVSRRDLFR